MGSVGRRPVFFWAGCMAVCLGVILHLPMLAMAHAMDNELAGMPMDTGMLLGMGLIAGGAVLACAGALPARHLSLSDLSDTRFEAREDMPLNRWHVATLLVLTLGLVIDVMKPATLGFVLPGMLQEYELAPAEAALLPLVALAGTTLGSFLWGWLADVYGRRVSILLSTILFVSTAICGAMPEFVWNLVMCFLMGVSAGGMLPVIYTLLAEVMPPRHRSWVLVLVGGTGLVGGYLAASLAAYVLEPIYGWRSLWLQGFPSGLLLLALARFIPESPQFLVAQGEGQQLNEMQRKFGLVAISRSASIEGSVTSGVMVSSRFALSALTLTALCWSFVNFGLLLWLPLDLQMRGYSAAVASGILARSSLLAFPTVVLAAYFYARHSSKWTLAACVMLTVAGLIGALALPSLVDSEPLLVAIIAVLIIGTNGTIAVLLPYTAESFPLAKRGRATGLVAGSSKFGGVAVQIAALAGLVPTLGGAAAALILPTALSAGLIAWAGRETQGRSLQDLEKE